jgi:hypothetical protein
MGLVSLRHGRRYKITLTLGWVESIASNNMIADRLRSLSFSDVTVTGNGGVRIAEALWPGENIEAEVPSQVKSIEEVQ